MGEIDPPSSENSPSELNETVVATMPWPEPHGFKEFRKQHPKSKFIWHQLSAAKKTPESDDKQGAQQKDEEENHATSEFNRIGLKRQEIANSGLLELYKEATIILTSDILPLPDQAPKLKLIQLFAAGFDHLLKDPLFTDTDIIFATANGVHGPQITEHVFMTLLAINHHFPLLLSWQQSRCWGKRSTPIPPVYDLVAQRIGILGYGSIGRQVARVAHSLGMSIHAYTASPRPTPGSKRDTGYVVPGTGDPDGAFPEKWYSGTRPEELHEFLGSGLDVLVASVPLTKDTRHFLSTREFDILSAPRHKTGKGAFVINISRGGIIDHDALLVALKKGLKDNEGGLKGASLDVTEPEPLPKESELWGLENVVITPHISGHGSAYLERVIGILALNLERLRTGGRLVNVVDRKREY